MSVLIAASTNPVCAGTLVTFTGFLTNEGSLPAFQWKVKGINVGTDNPLYSCFPTTHELITCMLTSDATCPTGNTATSNTVTMTVNIYSPSPTRYTRVLSQTQFIWNGKN